MITKKRRIEIFRQLKSQIRGSEQYMLVGIDIAKEQHRAFLGTPNGKTIYRGLIFDNNRKGFETLEHNTREMMEQSKLSKVVYGIEPTSRYHKPLAEYLIRRGENIQCGSQKESGTAGRQMGQER